MKKYFSVILILAAIIAAVGLFYGGNTRKVLARNFTEVTDVSKLSISGAMPYATGLYRGERIYFSGSLLNETYKRIKAIDTPLEEKLVNNNQYVLRYSDAFVVLQEGLYKNEKGTVIYMGSRKHAYNRHYHSIVPYFGGGSIRNGSSGGGGFRGGSTGFGK